MTIKPKRRRERLAFRVIKGGLCPADTATTSRMKEKAYNEGDLVLDNCAGSGTTGVACQNLNRNCILIEKEPDYCQIIRERMRTVEDLIVEERKQQTLTDFIPAK